MARPLYLLKEKVIWLYETILYVILIKTQHAIQSYTIKLGDMQCTLPVHHNLIHDLKTLVNEQV